MCHTHGALAMGGMSTIVPPKNDEAGKSRALAGIEIDKLMEFDEYLVDERVKAMKEEMYK